MKIKVKIIKDFNNPQRNGEIKFFDVSYIAEIHSYEFHEKIRNYAPGAIIQQSIIQ